MEFHKSSFDCDKGQCLRLPIVSSLLKVQLCKPSLSYLEKFQALLLHDYTFARIEPRTEGRARRTFVHGIGKSLVLNRYVSAWPRRSAAFALHRL